MPEVFLPGLAPTPVLLTLPGKPVTVRRLQPGQISDLPHLVLVGMQVDRRRLEVGVAQPGLDRPNIRAIPHQASGCCVSDRVGLDTRISPHSGDGLDLLDDGR
jgi:hypothetical protein